jgi:hypothetical protein
MLLSKKISLLPQQEKNAQTTLLLALRRISQRCPTSL